ncbi:MAG TPA: M48 family metalloprotease [Bacteroidia bacterium]|nr:M48 family metalloprotease [Bacteroidia bacterium]
MRTLTILLLFLLTGLYQAQNYSRDVKMGKKAAQQVEEEMGFFKHDTLQQLISRLGAKLVSHLEKKPEGFEFEFFLVDAPEPNAFALPGGHIYVTRGILPIVQSEDELAGIMAHEIIHVVNRHSVRQYNRNMVPSVLKIPGNIINGITRTRLGNIINVPIDLISSPFIAKYSRKHERQSDIQGIALAARAGYQPDQLAGALERLSREMEVITGEAEHHSFLNDHPYTPHRVEDIHKHSKKLQVEKSQAIYPSHERFILSMKNLCFGDNPRHGSFVDSVLYVQPELGFSIRLPLGWPRADQPEALIANDKNKDAALALSVVKEKKSPHDCGTEMQKKLKPSQKGSLEFAGDSVINGLPAYILRLSGKKKNETVVLELIWIQHNNMTYQIEGVALGDKRKLLASSMRSFMPATDRALSKVKIYELNVVNAREGESLQELSARSGNKLHPRLTCIFNDLEDNSKLKSGQGIKIVEEKPYRP